MGQQMIYDGHRFYKQKDSWRKMTKPRRFLHQYIWEKENGPIPPGWDVHHIDGDHQNNELENLTIVEHGKHSTITNSTRDYSTTNWNRYFSEEHRKNMSVAAKNRPKRLCEHCGREFDPTNYIRWHGDKCHFSTQTTNN